MHHGFGHDPRLETRGQMNDMFEMPDSRDPRIDGRPGFAFGSEDREGARPSNGPDWRGGPDRGRGRHEFGFERGRGRGHERPFEQGDLRWLVLLLIAAQPRHGYEIIKEIEDKMNGYYSPSPGVIYPTLTFLEETGLIISEAQAAKKLYSITDEGRASLEANAATIQSIRERIESIRARFGAPPAPEMMRAMDNLRTAIQVRLSKGELSPESLAIVTAALDRAAGEIERS